MRYSGVIKKLDKIIISDPSYEAGTDCRYFKEKLNMKNCLIDIRIEQNNEEEDLGFTYQDIYILIKKPEESVSFSKVGFEYDTKNTINEVTIAMDSASIALGVNKFANEIINSKDEWQPSCSLKTLSDGIFGSVAEGTVGDEVNFIYIAGYIDDDADYSEKELIDYLEKQLMIVNLQKIEQSKDSEEDLEHIEDNINYKEENQLEVEEEIVPDENLQL